MTIELLPAGAKDPLPTFDLKKATLHPWWLRRLRYHRRRSESNEEAEAKLAGDVKNFRGERLERGGELPDLSREHPDDLPVR